MVSTESLPSGLQSGLRTGSSAHSDRLFLYLAVPTIAMSLGWGLRGTIGGGQIGALIPGAIVTLCLCWLLGRSRSVGIVAAIGTVAIGLGGQETYGQKIGFLRTSETLAWGLAGVTTNGAMWGLSGGVLVGLALMHEKYRWREIAMGLWFMIAGTVLGCLFIDEPKLLYFSNRLDKPREEVWVGVTLGALALMAYLIHLRRERISTAFAWAGMLAGGAGFGIGGAFIAFGSALPAPYRGWPWWKVMEFTFGALYGLGLGAACYWHRQTLREQAPATEERSDFLEHAPLGICIVAGLAVAVGALWLNFTIPYRAIFSILAPGLVLIALWSNRLAWHIALSMTICGFFRDFLRRGVDQEWLPAVLADWGFVTVVTLPVVVIVALSERKGRLTAKTALLGLTWLATLFGLIKIGIPRGANPEQWFVPAVFFLEAVAATLLIRGIRPKSPAEE